MTFIVILGMHRSGTSCVAHMVNESGMYIGENLIQGNPDNLDGHFESSDAVRINDAILNQSGGSWDSPPSQITVNAETIQQATEFVESFRSHSVSGWKDPRTVLTYPFWRPLLGDHWILACLRNPTAVARSLETRHGWPLERGYRLWFEYNSRLASHVQNHPRVLWFDYDRPAQQQQLWLKHACQLLQLTPSPSSFAVFDRFQKHHAPAPAEDRQCEALYQQLRQEALRNWSPPTVETVSLNETELNPAEDLLALVRLSSRHNAILQRFDRMQHDAGSMLRNLSAQSTELDRRLTGIECLEQQLEGRLGIRELAEEHFKSRLEPLEQAEKRFEVRLEALDRAEQQFEGRLGAFEQAEQNFEVRLGALEQVNRQFALQFDELREQLASMAASKNNESEMTTDQAVPLDRDSVIQLAIQKISELQMCLDQTSIHHNDRDKLKELKSLINLLKSTILTEYLEIPEGTSAWKARYDRLVVAIRRKLRKSGVLGSIRQLLGRNLDGTRRIPSH